VGEKNQFFLKYFENVDGNGDEFFGLGFGCLYLTLPKRYYKSLCKTTRKSRTLYTSLSLFMEQAEQNREVRRILLEHLASKIADGDAVRIPYNIDTREGNMEVLLLPGPTDIQAKLTMGGSDIGCKEFGLCQLNSLANAVLLYNAEYVTKYKNERGGQPNQNGMATLLFGNDMHSSVYGTVVVAPSSGWE